LPPEQEFDAIFSSVDVGWCSDNANFNLVESRPPSLLPPKKRLLSRMYFAENCSTRWGYVLRVAEDNECTKVIAICIILVDKKGAKNLRLVVKDFVAITKSAFSLDVPKSSLRQWLLLIAWYLKSALLMAVSTSYRHYGIASYEKHG
jgi:hypothetical protein